jgi:hypothetical protein
MRRTDGQTDRREASRNFANAPKIRCNYSHLYSPHSESFTSTFFFEVFLDYNLLVGRKKFIRSLLINLSFVI